MRRMRQTRVKTFYIRPRSVTKDSEGVPIVSYGIARPVQGEIWPAESKRQIEQYGDRISDIANMYIQGYYIVTLENDTPVIRMQDGTVIRMGDGICIYAGETDQPDYTVLSFTPYTPLRLEVERRYV